MPDWVSGSLAFVLDSVFGSLSFLLDSVSDPLSFLLDSVSDPLSLWFSFWSFSDSASDLRSSFSALSLSCLDFSKHLHPYLKDDFHLNQCHCLSSLPQDFFL
nr:hypothetical protein [Mycoplasmopsis bovis]